MLHMADFVSRKSVFIWEPLYVSTRNGVRSFWSHFKHWIPEKGHGTWQIKVKIYQLGSII